MISNLENGASDLPSVHSQAAFFNFSFVFPVFSIFLDLGQLLGGSGHRGRNPFEDDSRKDQDCLAEERTIENARV